jgi:hypothetical protein
VKKSQDESLNTGKKQGMKLRVGPKLPLERDKANNVGHVLTYFPCLYLLSCKSFKSNCQNTTNQPIANMKVKFHNSTTMIASEKSHLITLHTEIAPKCFPKLNFSFKFHLQYKENFQILLFYDRLQ